MRLDRPVALAFAIVLASSACSTASAPATQRQTVLAVTPSSHLIRFNAGAPGTLLSTKALTGLQPGETLLGIGYRVAKGWLYAVGSSNRLYRVNALTANATPVGEPFTVPLTGTHFGVAFNPAEDLLRIVSDTGQSLRVDPDTAAVVDGDPTLPGVQADGPLAYATGDPADQQRPAIVAAACVTDKAGGKPATTFALDAATGSLVTLGSREGRTPAMSPNAGHLFTVGALGAGPFAHAALDAAHASSTALAALTATDATESRWLEVDLLTGTARLIGVIGGGEAVIGIAIEP